MATHLNLDEQEQLQKIKDFWGDYGRAIIMAIVLAIAIIGGWYGWNYLQNKKSQEAAALYDQFQQALIMGDSEEVKRTTLQMQSDYKSTSYASATSLMASVYFYQDNDLENAKSTLMWIKENGKDAGWNGIAILRLADVLTDQAQYDEALSVLETKVDPAFAAHIADKRGNVYLAQDKKEQAKGAYIEAYKGLPNDSQKELVGGKLRMLGVDVNAISALPVATEGDSLT